MYRQKCAKFLIPKNQNQMERYMNGSQNSLKLPVFSPYLEYFQTSSATLFMVISIPLKVISNLIFS
jgi:hypothetical protein